MDALRRVGRERGQVQRPLLVALLVAAGCGHSPKAVGDGGVDGGPLAAVSLSQLDQDTGVTWSSFSSGGYGSALQLVPNTSPTPTATGATTAVAAAQAFLSSYGSLFGIGFASELSLVFTPVPDEAGLTWVSFQQIERGVPVFERRVLVGFDANGSIGLVWSGYVPGLQGLSVTPAQTAAQAVAAARANLQSLQAAEALGAFIDAATPELVIYPGVSSSSLAYFVQLSYGLVSMEYWIDAQSGAVLASSDALETVLPTLGTVPDTNCTPANNVSGVGSLGDTKQLTVGETTDYFYLQQQLSGLPVQPNGGWIWVQTLDASGRALASADPSSSEVSAANGVGLAPNWSSVAGQPPGEAVDAYQWVSTAEQWFQNRGWRSFNNAGGNIAIGQYGTILDNTGWDPTLDCFKIFLPQSALPPTVALDVMGHEYTHATVEYTLRLNLFGAAAKSMNEALADEFGQMIERDTATSYASNSATVGEAWVGSDGIRNLQNPHLTTHPSAQPNNVYDALYNPGTTDPYPNDGIPNAAWYATAFGGQNSTSLITVPNGMAWSDVETLYSTFLFAGCAGHAAVPAAAGGGQASAGCGPSVLSLQDLQVGLTATAKMLFHKCSTQMQSVGCAWYSVGVGTDGVVGGVDPDRLADTFGVTACQCPGVGTYCGSQITYGAHPNSLYTCDANGLVSVTNCLSQTSAQAGCGSPNPASTGTPITPVSQPVGKQGAFNEGCWPTGAAPGQACGGSTACACPLACIGSVCTALNDATCLPPSSGTSDGTSGGGSSGGSTGGMPGDCTYCDGDAGTTVLVTYDKLSASLGCWFGVQPPPAQGIYAEMSNVNAFTCGIGATVTFYMNEFNEPGAGSCPPLAVGASYDLEKAPTANCIEVVATAENGSWEGQAGMTWSGIDSTLYGGPPSCTGSLCLDCAPATGAVVIESLDPFTLSIGANLFSVATIGMVPLVCPMPGVVGISGTMSGPLVPYPSTSGGSGGTGGSATGGSTGGSSSSSSSGGGPICP